MSNCWAWWWCRHHRHKHWDKQQVRLLCVWFLGGGVMLVVSAGGLGIGKWCFVDVLQEGGCAGQWAAAGHGGGARATGTSTGTGYRFGFQGEMVYT